MGKTDKKTDKADKKVKKTEKKTCKKCGALIALFALASVFATGCASTGAQPSRSQTQNNNFDRCVVVIAADVSVTNETVIAKSGDGFVPSEIFTQTMKNEGNETATPTASPTNTTRIDPKTDVNTTGGRSAGVLESLIGSFGAWLATPGGKEAAAKAAQNCPDGNCGECSDGSCSIGGANCPGGNCSP